ncbi:NUDIX domain-containing protein [Candidatus Berkelbacteria bacterium]|nr:NUDIX domain-containing protein [Candidatus Berkelbacteria bacterium]
MANEQFLVPLAVIKRDDKLLLVFKHTSSAVMCTNKWEIPGSRIEFGLSLEESLIAKTKRALGIDITIKEVLGNIYSSVSDKIDGTGQVQYFIVPVLCQTDATDFVIDRSKLREARWFSLAEIEDLYAKGELVDLNDLDIARHMLT